MHCKLEKHILTTLAILRLLPTLSGAQASSSETLVPISPPCLIQGHSLVSPLNGRYVRTRGVVFADFDKTSKRGFFIQEENCDGDPNTSDGIFVYNAEETDVVSVGDYVEVFGYVKEYNDLTEITVNPADVSLLSEGKALPKPVALRPPLEEAAAQSYLESLESMYIQMEQAIIVGPTNWRGETWVIDDSLGLRRVFQADEGGYGEVILIDNEGVAEISLAARVGDSLANLLGVLDYSFGAFRVQLLSEPLLKPNPDLFQPCIVEEGLSIATFNVGNLFDDFDDPGTKDQVLTSDEYTRKLRKLALAISSGLGEPDILALQEVENSLVLADLLAQPEIVSDYGWVWVDGPDPRGIDVALLYRSDLIEILEVEQLQGCTSLVDGLGPDGNGNVIHPNNQITCDTDGDGILDGNRLFSRPPLSILVHLQGSTNQALYARLILNHWKSKAEDTQDKEYTLPRRIEEAIFISNLVQEALTTQPDVHLIVLGDLNDYPNSQPIRILEEAGLYNLVARLPLDERYTYIFQGISQVIDHILVSPILNNQLISVCAVHMNADYPEIFVEQEDSLYRNSDHDPLMMRLSFAEDFLYIPLITLDK